MKKILFLIYVAIILVSCSKDEIKPSAKSQIKFIDFQKSNDGSIKINFNDGFGRKWIVEFKEKEVGLYNIYIYNPDNKIKEIECPDYCPYISEIGNVVIGGNDCLFFQGGGGGTGEYEISLNLIPLNRLELITLTLWFSTQVTEIPEISSTSDNYKNPLFQKEREFLENLKYDYGYFDEKYLKQHGNNHRVAYYFWKKYNDKIDDGKMKIIKYKGKHLLGNSILHEVKDNGIVYSAYFKAGVVAYDEKNDEHYVLFHPHDMYCWPTVLAKRGSYLFIGSGEGLAIINLDTFHLRRVENIGYVDRIEITDNKIKINDEEIINFQEF